MEKDRCEELARRSVAFVFCLFESFGGCLTLGRDIVTCFGF